MIDIVFENSSLLVINKPSGLVVNRSVTASNETLQDQISNYFNLKQGDLGVGDRAGIVHRLDRETSGLIIIAKTQKTFVDLQEQFESRKVKKTYIALVHGFVNLDSGVVDLPIRRLGKFGKFGIGKDGRKSETVYKVEDRFLFKQVEFDRLISGESRFTKVRTKYLKAQAKNYSLLSLMPKTGRTHQIRVHLKSLGTSVVSDLIYGPSKLLKFDFLWCSRLFLHATQIEFKDPSSKKQLKFEAALPKELENALSYLTISAKQ